MAMQKIYLYSLFFLLWVLGACSNKASDASLSGATGKGGSMARFAINGDYLYTVDTQNLRVFDVANPSQPVYKATKALGFDIETIFPKDQYLFIGTQTGMQIVSVQNPLSPQVYSTYSHIRSCDPVVVQDTIAYVTLRAGTSCDGGANQLEIIDVKNLFFPRLLNTYPLTNPYGLGVDSTRLFVCDGSAGVRMFNIQNRTQPVELTRLNIPNAYDVIPLRDKMIISGGDGIYQYRYWFTNNNLEFLSKISVER